MDFLFLLRVHVSFNRTSIVVTHEIVDFPPIVSAIHFAICIRCTSRAHGLVVAMHSKHTTRAYARYHVYILCSRSAAGIDTFASWKENRPFNLRKLAMNS